MLVIALALVFQAVTGPAVGTGGMEGIARSVERPVLPGEAQAFARGIKEARLLVDGNGNPAAVLAELQKQYPGRHEVWALSARFQENMGDDREALMDYARAVRLKGDYLDEGSPLYLGGRIKSLVKRTFSNLSKKKKQEGLAGDEKELLKVVYFLRRRIAGGCE